MLVAALPGVIDPSYDLVHIVVSRAPLAAAERAEFQRLCAELEFQPLFPRPDGGGPGDLYARVAADDLEPLARELPFSIWPPTDDRPFQYGIDWSHLRRAAAQGSLLSLLARNPLVSLGAGIGAVGALVTLLPLALLRARVATAAELRRGGGRCCGVLRGHRLRVQAVEIDALLRLQT